ncbi:MAG: MFS transporter [Nitriliruptor sp.]|nr:MAG: MFS transporter [Nitriliruptor sp.]
MTAGASDRGRPPRRSPLGVLRVREFRIYWLGASLSSIGTWFQNIAAGLLVYELTRSTLAVGAVNFAQFIGSILLVSVAGGAADRYDRRRLLMVSQGIAAVVGAALATVTLLGAVTPAIVIGAALLLGFSLAFMVPALLALVPLLVDEADLDAAIAINSVSFNLARAVGPVLGALVVGSAGYGVAFALNALSFLAFVGALALVRPRPQRRAEGDRPRLLETIRLVRSVPAWWAVLVATTVISMSTDPINTLVPELALDTFGGRELDAGLFVGAFGLGATLTALTLTDWLRRRRRALPGAMLVQGAGMLLVGLAPTIGVAYVGMAISGGGFIAGITRSSVRLQSEVPDLQRGRVMALWSVAFVGTRPFAALISGAIAEIAGARVAALALSLPVLLLAPWVGRQLEQPTPPVR